MMFPGFLILVILLLVYKTIYLPDYLIKLLPIIVPFHIKLTLCHHLHQTSFKFKVSVKKLSPSTISKVFGLIDVSLPHDCNAATIL